VFHERSEDPAVHLSNRELGVEMKVCREHERYLLRCRADAYGTPLGRKCWIHDDGYIDDWF
jgi:hypothetical protein